MTLGPTNVIYVGVIQLTDGLLVSNWGYFFIWLITLMLKYQAEAVLLWGEVTCGTSEAAHAGLVALI